MSNSGRNLATDPSLNTTYGLAARSSAVAAGQDRQLYAPGVLIFSPHFVQGNNAGEYVGVVCIKTGANYKITTLWSDDDLGSVIQSDDILATGGTDYFDPFLIKLPNGNILTGFHDNNGILYFYRSTDGGRTWVSRSTILQAPAPTSFTATAVGTGGTFAAGAYYWKVVATTASGDSVPSAEATATLVLNGSANLAWTNPAGTTGVKVYRGTAPGAENVLVTTLGVVTTYTDTGSAGTAGTPAPLRRYSEACIIRLRQPGTGTATRLICSFVDVDPNATRDTVIRTVFSDDEAGTWSASTIATPTSGASSCAQLSDNLRAWIFEDVLGNVQLLYSRKANGSPAEVWAENLNNIGQAPSGAPVKVAVATLATSTTGQPQNGTSPSAIRQRNGKYILMYSAANYGSGGSSGELHMIVGDGTKAGWTGTDTVIGSTTTAPNGYGRITPHRLSGGTRLEALYVTVPSPTSVVLRSLHIING